VEKNYTTLQTTEDGTVRTATTLDAKSAESLQLSHAS